MDKQQLAHFLRSRRAHVTPREVGLPEGGSRRTPGLRRQEVAQLAGMSIDYYIRLEQGRGPTPSRQVLNALGRALMLNADERAHLFHLAGRSHPLVSPAPGEVTPEIRLLLSNMAEVPAFVVNPIYDVLAWNTMASVVMGGLETRAAHDRNVIRWAFREPDEQTRAWYPERDYLGELLVADLRASAARFPGNQAIRDLVQELSASSPHFAGLWADHRIAVKRNMSKHLYHPLTGPFEVICQILWIQDTDQRIVAYTAEPGSAPHRALRTLCDAIREGQLLSLGTASSSSRV
ncbi:helix-turn-helix transcriptional regulator [Sinosporangium siamense]|uniref:Transcriptional regulator n=1 Tax=Sinosporangium siamense TaxID=1367973 RepID=A0A919RAK7_9ACTN|nr:helix-turn-helix transcriptional regulator [Sinosporangium siamense]GII90426.1 transcriptional regulator [Sinosporangium siamense]